MGSATLYRIPQVVMARYEARRAELEQPLRERSKIPADAVTVQFGLDGVMVPQEGEHCDPRGRTPKGDPEPPRTFIATCSQFGLRPIVAASDFCAIVVPALRQPVDDEFCWT